MDIEKIKELSLRISEQERKWESLRDDHDYLKCRLRAIELGKVTDSWGVGTETPFERKLREIASALESSHIGYGWRTGFLKELIDSLIEKDKERVRVAKNICCDISKELKVQLADVISNQ